MDSPEDEGTTTATETTTPATSPPRSAEIYDSAAYNLINPSPIKSPRTGPFLPEFQSPLGLFEPPQANFDRRTAYPRWFQEPQMPSSELFPQAPVRPSFSALHASQIAIRPYDPALLNQIRYQTDPCNKRNYVSQYLDTDAAANLYQSSPQKSRKKASDDDDSKCCHCKKTRCLKLYCECFALGFYCTKACGCQDCYNTLDYEDTVQASRELIENRNPLAFAPKEADGIDSTPSSRRQKRGCNCKKTRCQKKYCECYQSKSGCTNGCGCDECENVYGKKGDYRKRTDMLSKGSIRQSSGIEFDEKLEKAATEDVLSQTELSKLYSLSSPTPPCQSQYLRSPASNLDSYQPNGKFPQNYWNFENSPSLPKSRNYSEGGYVPKRFGLQNSDMADSLSPENGFPNSFDQNSVFNCPFSRIPSSGYLPFSDLQFTQIQPGNEPMQTDELDVSLYFRYEDDNHAVLDGYTPLREVKSLSSSEKSFPTPASSPQVSSSSTSSGGAHNVQLRSVPLFPPLTPLGDPKGHSSSEIQDDSTNKRRRSREVFL